MSGAIILVKREEIVNSKSSNSKLKRGGEDTLFYLVEDGKELDHRFGTEHADARGTEVGDALEEGRSGEVTADVEDARMFAQPPDALEHLLTKDVQLR